MISDVLAGAVRRPRAQQKRFKDRVRRAALAAAAALIAAAAAPAPAAAQLLLRDTEIEQWIDDYSLPLFRAAGLPAEQVNIFLIGDPTPNAFAGGLNMGIHTGLITLADTPNQVQGVIAHEAGHIAGGHTARSDEALSAASRPMFLSLLLAGAAVAAGAPEAGIGLLGLGQNVALANALQFSRGQESSADQAAITYLDGVGASSRGLIEFFGKLRNFQVITGRRVNPYLQTHPLANDRMTALERRATDSAHYGAEDSPEEIARLRMIQAKIKGFLQEPKSTFREYPNSDQSDPGRYARAVAYYRDARIDEGLKEVDALIGKYPDNPYFHELKGQMLFEFGRVAASVEPHRKAVTLAPTKALLRINLGRALLAAGAPDQLDEAVGAFNGALAIEPDNGFAWFELSRVYGAKGDLPMAHLATAESRYHAGDKVAANQFARRAMRGLPKGSPQWRRATDVIVATQGELPNFGAADNRRRRDQETPDRDRGPNDVPDPPFR